MAEAILLTGPPGCGKTSAIRAVLSRLPVQAGGFYTAEIREGGVRTGFSLLMLDGREEVLADIRVRGRPRIGKYGVDLEALESPIPLLGSVMLRRNPFADDIKARPEVTVFPISRRDWSEAVEAVLDRLHLARGG